MLPPRRLQSKAVMMMCGGGVLTLVWDAAIYMLLALSGRFVIPLSLGGVAMMGVVLLAPFIVASSWAMRMPKAMTLNCEYCKWSRSWIVGP
ncbi:MAG: hypothetical protein K8T25_01925 [Planctomycetia bacterium]|nr:hypothetical protein [Planctomycetia bacterium]